MSIHSVLLRLLLIIVLMLDGTATAMASAVHMNHVGMATTAAQVASTAKADEEGEMPCHDVGANEAKVVTATDSGEHEHGSPDTGAPAQDCCEGACDCACVHPVQAAVVAALVSVGSIGHSDIVRPMFSVHASPALPHLIRPPIG
ncbi:MAG: CopL family metal-binding regulatory protein [Lysobacter sp.]